MARLRTNGFSLVEVMIVAGLVAVLAAISTPAITAGMRRYSLISASQHVVSTIRGARLQAVGRNATFRVRFNDPADGQYQVYQVVGGAETSVGGVQYLPDGADFGDVSDDVEFDPSGRVTGVMGAAPVTIVVTNGDEDQNKTITVSASGRVQLP